MVMRKPRFRVAAIALAAALLAPATADADATRLAGTDAVGTQVSSSEPGRAQAYRTTATNTGDASSISVHLDASSTATALEVGLYSDVDGQPATLLTSGRATSVVAGWNEVAVPPARLRDGDHYWIALLNPADGTGTLRWTDRVGGGGSPEQGSASASLSALPDEWATGLVFSDGPLSGFVTGSELPADLSVVPSALSFWATAGGASPAPKTLAIDNNGSGSLTFSASESSAWLSVSPSTGSAPASVSVRPDTRGLAAGTYTTTVRIDAGGAEGSPRDVPVTLTVNPARSANGLVGAWAFDEASGDSVLDASGRRNTGTIMGATRTEGQYGRGLEFDGEDDWVTVADSSSLDLTTGMTLSAWVKPAALGANWRTVVIKERSDQLAYALYANTDAGKPSGHVFTDRDNGLAGPTSLAEGEWSHVATTWDGETLRLFVNGAEVANMPLSGPAITSTGALRIGGNAVWGEWFEGRIDEVRVYNRALSAEELLADRDTPISAGSGSQMSPLEKLKALLMRLIARWKKHWGDWSWHGHRGHFHGGR
jgi:hypothetical protein